jgi:hypothetical protein
VVRVASTPSPDPAQSVTGGAHLRIRCAPRYFSLMTSALDPLREAVSQAAARDGITRVALATDVALGTLRKFLAGAPVRADVRGKLQSWASPSKQVDVRGARPLFGSGL